LITRALLDRLPKSTPGRRFRRAGWLAVDAVVGGSDLGAAEPTSLTRSAGPCIR